MTTDDSIRSMLRTAHSLERAIDQARRDMTAASEKKKQYERRLGEVQSIYSRLHGAVSGDSTDCRAVQRACKNRLDAATMGFGREADLLDSLDYGTEKAVEQDDRGCEMSSHIVQEISRCRQEIDAASASYASASSRERQALSSRSYHIKMAKDLAASSDATVKVWESTRY